MLRLFTDFCKSLLLLDYRVGAFSFKAHLAGVIKSENRLLISLKQTQEHALL